jgi:hypothetical protein
LDEKSITRCIIEGRGAGRWEEGGMERERERQMD